MTWTEIAVGIGLLVVTGILASIIAIEIHNWRHSHWPKRRRRQ